MLDIFTGEFLRHPAALEYSGATCQHGCAYCFATAHGKESKSSLKSVVNFLYKPKAQRKTYKDALFMEGMPLLISNRTDPFSPNNIDETEKIFEALRDFPNGVFVQTKGHEDYERAIKIIDLLGPKRAVIYMSLSIYDADIADVVEPGCPDPWTRAEMMRTLKGKGYHVMAALNPVFQPWLPEPDAVGLINHLAENCGIDHFYVQGLHLSPRRLAGYTKGRKDRLMGLDGMRDFEARSSRHAEDAALYLIDGKQKPWTCKVFYLGWPQAYNFWGPCDERFPTMPTEEGFFAEIIKKKGDKESIQVTFQDFIAHCAKGRERLFNAKFARGEINRYLFTANQKAWRKFQDVDNLTWLCNVAWNSRDYISSMFRHPALWPIKDGDGLLQDSNGDFVYYFDGSLRSGKEVKGYASN